MLLKIQDCFSWTLNRFQDTLAKGLLIYADSSNEVELLVSSCKNNIVLKDNPSKEIIDFANGAAISGRPVASLVCANGEYNDIILNILDLAKTLSEPTFKHINVLIDNDFSTLDVNYIGNLFSTLDYKIYLPSNPYDFCSLLKIALEDANPNFFLISPDIFEVQGPVPDFETDPLTKSQSKIRKEANDVSIIATGEDIFQACEYADSLPLNAEIIETRVISPIDYQTLTNSILKTKNAKIIQTNSYLENFNQDLCSKLQNLCKDAFICIERIECNEN
ncbi:MAG: transketolase C-terminal domain-containing protein [Bdellovibrionota bacterium]